jgi:hypothetical protein
MNLFDEVEVAFYSNLVVCHLFGVPTSVAATASSRVVEGEVRVAGSWRSDDDQWWSFSPATPGKLLVLHTEAFISFTTTS